MAKKASSNDKMIGVVGDIYSALENMGFTKGEIAQAVATVLPTSTFGEGLRQCLKYLGSKPGSRPAPAPVQKPSPPAAQQTPQPAPVAPPKPAPAATRESPTQAPPRKTAPPKAPSQPKAPKAQKQAPFVPLIPRIKEALTPEVLKTRPKPAKQEGKSKLRPGEDDDAAKLREQQEERAKIAKDDRVGRGAGNKGGAISRIGKSLLHNYQDEGRYNDELKDEDASKFHKNARGLLKLASGGNSLAMRTYDHLTSKKKDRLEEFDEDSKKLAPSSKETSRVIETAGAGTAESLSSEKSSGLLEKVVEKLEEIKKTLIGMKPKGVPGLTGGKQKLLPAPKTEGRKFKPATAETANKLSRFRPDSRPARPMLDINKQAKSLFPKREKPQIGKLMSSGLPKFTPQTTVPGVRGLPSMKPASESLPQVPEVAKESGGLLDGAADLYAAGQMGKGAAGKAGKLGRLGMQAGRASLPMMGVIAAGAAGVAAGTAINNAYGKEIGEGVEGLIGKAGQDKTDEADKFAKKTAADLKKRADEGKAMTPAQITLMKDNGIDVSGITPAGSKLVANSDKARANANALAPHLDRELETQGVTKTPEQKAMVLGQISHETGGFSKMKEGDYSAKRVWDLRGKELEKQGVSRADVFAAEKKGGSAAMDEYMMADKYRGKGSKLGNTEPGDATKYKGRGAIQLTGKANYEKASKELGIDLVNKPELAEEPETAAKIAAWKLKNNPIAMKGIQEGDVDRLSQGINGGKYKKSHGREERISKTLQAEQQLSALQKGAPQVSANEIEAKTMEIAKASTQPIVIQAGAQAAPQQTVASNAGANKGIAPMISRNTDSSISAITRAQMGYGLA